MRILLFILFFALYPVSKAEIIKPVSLITEEWPPYNYTENGVIKGFSTEVVQLVMKDLKLNLKINVLPDARGMNELNNSPRTMFFSFIKTPERENHYKWIGPFAEESIYFYKKKGSSLKINSLEDAKKVGFICVRASGLVLNKLKAAGFKNFEKSIRAESIYLKAINGRCDLAIGESPAGVTFWLKKLKQPVDSLVRTPAKLLDFSLYIVASKDIPDSEIVLWQERLEKVKTSKEFSLIKQKYNKY